MESETESEFENKKENRQKSKHGKLNIKDFVIRRRKKRPQVFKCPLCKHKDKTQGENKHLKDKHLDFKI